MIKKPYIHLSIAFIISVLSLATLCYGWRAAWNSAFWEKSLLYFMIIVAVALLYLSVSLIWSVVSFCLSVSRKHKTMLILLLIPFLFTGCGTIMTISPSRDPLVPEPRVYAGVRVDIWSAFSREASGFIPLWVRGLIVVDIPISAVTDTVCLPYTIPKAISEKKKQKESSNQ